MNKEYLKNQYKKELDSKVKESGKDWIIAENTIFYPESGGQPSDKGKIVWRGKEIDVKKVVKENGDEKIYLNGDVPQKGDQVKQLLDWNRRYKHMRMHSAQHLLSAIALEDYDAETSGNQIHAERSRIDLKHFSPSKEKVRRLEKRFNHVVRRALPIKHYEKERKKVLEEVDAKRRRLFERIPSSITEIRVIEIPEIDKCPCAGTHVENTEEIGEIDIQKTKSKGEEVTRVEYTLEEI